MSSLFDLSGKTAVVTGSSRGIGRAIAERLAEHGARVVISSRKLDACQAAAEEINARFGAGRAMAVAANISSKDDLAGLVRAAEDAFGQIDILVCNAATNPYFGPSLGISDEQFTKVLSNNILSNHWLIQMTAPAMAARGDGAIIIISSVGALRGSATIGAYNVSKAADLQMARNLAVELGPRNVRINCIAPGLVQTDFARPLWDDPRTLADVTATNPLRRIGQPDEIAGAAVFLASAAGSYVNGHALVVDGGGTISSGL